jgi:hypothetical protein
MAARQLSHCTRPAAPKRIGIWSTLKRAFGIHATSRRSVAVSCDIACATSSLRS